MPIQEAFPQIVFLDRGDGTGYGFFYDSAADFIHAADSFVRPILRSFAGEPVPGQPAPQEHLRSALQSFLNQAFHGSIPDEVGAEGVSRAVAALLRLRLGTQIPAVVVVEQHEGRIMVRPGLEYLPDGGYPRAVVLDADTHGGAAHFFPTGEDFLVAAHEDPTPACWLPQIIVRLYRRTPSVVVGKPIPDRRSGKSAVEFRAPSFGNKGYFVERQR